MTAVRRLAAILAIDVVGYSRPMGEDEVGAAPAVHEHREPARAVDHAALTTGSFPTIADLRLLNVWFYPPVGGLTFDHPA
jgi:hypothetical protein